MSNNILKNLKQLDAQIFRNISSHPNLQSMDNVEFHTSDNFIRLRGNVGSYFEKQLAQETIRNLDKDRTIENELEVSW